MVGAYTTVSIWDLPVSTTVDDVRRFFEGQVPECEPVISPLVLDSKTDTKASTVTFKCDSENALQAAVARLKANNVLEISSPYSKETIGIGQSFRHLTTLACKSENPAFDIIFVHGLNGHAFNTFATRPRNHQEVRMWARDLLPDVLDCGAYSGRYMAYGYAARLIDWETIPHNLQQTALELLDQIMQDRPHDCQRPLFFVCHSLGGLVVSQAIALALQKNGPHPKYRELLMPRGECVVKGIAFFGTPFTGSVIANWEPITRIVPFGLNMSYVKYLKQRHQKRTLKVDPQDVSPVVDMFRDMVKEHDIPLQIYFEEKTMWGLPVVTRESAAAQFGDKFPPIGIFRNHKEMVKFESAKDIEFRSKVAPKFKKMVEKALTSVSGESSLSSSTFICLTTDTTRRPSLQLIDQPLHATPTTWIAPDAGMLPVLQLAQPTESLSFRGTTMTDARPVLGKLKLDIFQGLSSNRGHRIEKPIEGTCEWIQDRKTFMNWRDSTKNAVLFIIGGPGQGKSVLAKFSATNLAKYYSKKPIIVSYFVEKSRSGNTPDTILRHLLAQLWEADEACFERAITALHRSTPPPGGVEFLWALLSAFRLQMGTSLLCIIDGLDECIVESKAKGQTTVDEKMVGFLRQLCEIVKDTDGSTDGITTRVLVTSRPKQEVQIATSRKNVTYEIDPEDINAGVAAMIKASVKSIAEERGLSSKLEAFITEKLIAKSGSHFQLARSLIDLLRDRGYDLGSNDKVEQILANFNADDVRRPYFEALETMQVGSRAKAARLIRIVHFAFWELTMDKLQHALAMPTNGDERGDFTEFLDEGLEYFIKSNCSILLAVDKTTQKAYFKHPTIPEFFQDLPERDKKWSIFSCKEEAQGHLELALICVHYLLSWMKQPVTPEELSACEGSDLIALQNKSVFLEYAALCWPYHVRKAGELITPYVPLISKFLRTENAEYGYAAQVMGWNDDSVDFWDFKVEVPPHFLATYNLVHVLQALKIKSNKNEGKDSNNQRWSRHLPSLKTKAPVPAADVLEFGVDDRDYDDATPLHRAAQNGATETVEFLLKHGADGSLRNKDGLTPFCLALKGGYKKVADILIKYEQCQPGESADKYTLLHWACKAEMDEVVKVLLSKKADPNAATDDNWTPVHLAARQGNSGILRQLLEAGGKPDVRTTGDGLDTPLLFAVIQGSSAAVEVLVEFKPDLALSEPDELGCMPLYYAAQKGHHSLFLWLRNRGAVAHASKRGDLPIHTAADNGHLSIVELLLDRENIMATNKNKYSALHYAAQKGHLSVVKKLVEVTQNYGLSIDNGARDFSQRRELEPCYCVTPLMLAVLKGFFGVCKFLVEKGADPKAESYLKKNLLHFAAYAKNVEIFDFLVEKGVDPCTPDVKGRTAFHDATEAGVTEIVDRYIKMAQEKRIDINVRSSFDETPLFTAVDSKEPSRVDIVEKLLKSGADPNIVDVGGWSMVLSASRRKGTESTAVLKMLLDAGAKPDYVTKHGDTPISVATGNGNIDAIRILIEAGANVDSKDAIGQTPLFHALALSDTKITRLLLEANADPKCQDAFGDTPRDFALKADSLLWQQLSKYFPYTQYVPHWKHLSLIQEVIRKHLNNLPNSIDLDDVDCRTQLWANICVLGKCFLRSRKDADTRICYEYYCRRTSDDKLAAEVQCRQCKLYEHGPGKFYVCKDCFATLLCSKCWKSLQTRPLDVPCFKYHTFIVLGDDDYKDYPPGAVNKAGQTLEEWIAEKKKEYGVSGDSTNSGREIQKSEETVNNFDAKTVAAILSELETAIF